MRTKLPPRSAIAEQVRRYGRISKWLWADAIWRFKWPAIGVVLAAAGGVAAQGAVLGALVQYGRALENDTTVAMFGRSVPARSSVELLYGVVAIVVLLLTIAAFLQYLGRAGGVRLDGRYESLVAGRALEWLHATPLSGACLTPCTMEEAQYVVQGAPREMGRLLRISLQMTTPVVTVIASGVALFLLDWGLTLLVLVLSAVTAGLLYRVNLSAVAHTRAQVKYNPLASRRKKDLLRAWATRWGDRDTLQSDVAEVMDHLEVRRAKEAYVNRIAVVDSATLMTRGVAAVTIGLVTAVLGARIVESQTGFSTLVLYVLALRIFLNSITNTGRTFTSINRFYPGLRRYASFALCVRSQPTTAVTGDPLRLFVPHLVTTTTGAPSLTRDFTVLSNAAADRYLLGRVAQATNMVGAVDANAARLLARPTTATGATSLRDHYGLPGSFGSNELAEVAAAARIAPDHPFMLTVSDPADVVEIGRAHV